MRRDAAPRASRVRRAPALPPRRRAGRPTPTSRALAALAARAAHALRAGERARELEARARAHARAARGRRRGDRAPLARAHARDRSRADRGAPAASTSSASTCWTSSGWSPAAGRGARRSATRTSRSGSSSVPRARCAPAPPLQASVGGGDPRPRSRSRGAAHGGPADAVARAAARRADEPIGLLVAYPGRSTTRRERRRAARGARRRSSRWPCRTRACTSGRRHLGETPRRRARARSASRRGSVTALYEISRSFTQTLSLETPRSMP